ncbi:hypothetical protein COBT_000848 [Conglomerata obtusa]
MTHFKYKNRKQPSQRSHLGPLQSSKLTKKRLAEIKSQNIDLEKLKREVAAQTGDEFYFAMERKEIAPADVDKDILYLDWELRRAKKKVGLKSEGVHVRFGEESSINHGEGENKWKLYIKKLQMTKKELINVKYNKK